MFRFGRRQFDSRWTRGSRLHVRLIRNCRLLLFSSTFNNLKSLSHYRFCRCPLKRVLIIRSSCVVSAGRRAARSERYSDTVLHVAVWPSATPAYRCSSNSKQINCPSTRLGGLEPPTEFPRRPPTRRRCLRRLRAVVTECHPAAQSQAEQRCPSPWKPPEQWTHRRHGPPILNKIQQNVAVQH
jgi:hypothetical protein